MASADWWAGDKINNQSRYDTIAIAIDNRRPRSRTRSCSRSQRSERDHEQQSSKEDKKSQERAKAVK